MKKYYAQRRSDFSSLLHIQGEAKATPGNALADVRNFIYTPGGRLLLRRGFGRLTASPLGGAITGVAQLPWTVSELKLFCSCLTSIYEYNTATSTFDSIYTGQTSGYRTVFEACDGLIFFANGIDELRYYDGSVTHRCRKPPEGWYDDKNPETLLWSDSRLWTSVGPMVYASRVGVPNDFYDYSVAIPTGDSYPVRVLIPAFNKIFVIKDQSVGVISNEEKGYTYTPAYSSVDGTPSFLGACTHGDGIYYISTNGAFEIKSTGRETIGNFNTIPIHYLGIEPYFNINDNRHLKLESIINSIVVPHKARNEIWMFIGATTTTLDTILVYNKLLQRWTRFTVPNCSSACVYRDSAYLSKVAIGTNDGYVCVSDTTVNGKDNDADYVGNSYIDFLWAGEDSGQFEKTYRSFIPTILADRFKYSTTYNERVSGISNTTVTGSLDSKPYELPIELNGRGSLLRTRISGSAGYWPIEIESVETTYRLKRQKKSSTFPASGSWSLTDPAAITKREYPVARWTRESLMNWVYAGNDIVQAQKVEYKQIHYPVSNTITLQYPDAGAGKVAYIRGVWKETAIFYWDGMWAGTDSINTNYYTGGSFTNDSNLLKTTITLGSSIADNTPVIVRYMYDDDDTLIKQYESLNDYPCIQQAYRGYNNFTYDFALDMMLEMLCQFYMLYRDVSAYESICKAAIKFLWNEYEYVSQSRAGFCSYDTFERDTYQSGSLLMYQNVSDSDLVEISNEIIQDEGFNSRVLKVKMNWLSGADTEGAWIGYGLGWPISILDSVDSFVFKFRGGNSNKIILVDIVDALPFIDDYSSGVYRYTTGIPDNNTELQDLNIKLSQFYRPDTIIWDGCRSNPQITDPYRGANSTAGEVTFEKITEQVVSPEGDYIPCYFRVSIDTSNITIVSFTAGVGTEVKSSALYSGISLLVRFSAPITGMYARLRVTINGISVDTTVATTDTWVRVSHQFSSFSGLVHPITYVTVQLLDSTYPPTDILPLGKFDFTDICYCNSSGLPERIRFSDSGQYLRLIQWRVQAPGLNPITYQRWLSYGTPQTVNMSQSTITFYLDDVGFLINQLDAYPFAPRLAASYKQYGLDVWRGPSLVHYARPFASWIMEQFDSNKETNARVATLSQKREIKDSATEWETLQGFAGPVVPIHSRNDPENFSRLEGVNKFGWSRKWRTYGLEHVVYNFNSGLIDSSGNGKTLSWTGSGPSYTTGICVPDRNTSIAFDGSGYASIASFGEIVPILNNFSVTLILKGSTQGVDYCYIADKYAVNGWIVQSKTAGDDDIQLKLTTSVSTYYSDIADVLDDDWHIVHWNVNFIDNKIYKWKDGIYLGSDTISGGTGLTNTAPLQIGYSAVVAIDLFKYDSRDLSDSEVKDFYAMIYGGRFDYNHGKEVGRYNFWQSLNDTSGNGNNLTLSSGSPEFDYGYIQAGLTSILLANKTLTKSASGFNPGSYDFFVEAVFKTADDTFRFIHKIDTGAGWYIDINSSGGVKFYISDGSNTAYVETSTVVNTNDFVYLVCYADRSSVTGLKVFINGVEASYSTQQDPTSVGSVSNSVAFTIQAPSVSATIDFVRVSIDHIPTAWQIRRLWNMVSGSFNCSDYPELGCGFAQMLPFRNAALYRLFSGDTYLDDFITDYITWIDATAITDPSILAGGTNAYKMIHWFHPYGYSHGDNDYFDPAMSHGILLQGLIFCYWYSGNATALAWIERLMNDLRVNRVNSVLSTFTTDFAYSWMFAHIMFGFGLAEHELDGCTISNHISVSVDNLAFWEAMLTWVLSKSGNTKPNQLTADGIPYTFYDNRDSFSYAPDYMFDANCGSTEGLILMANVAFMRARQTGDYGWFLDLINFLVRVTK